MVRKAFTTTIDDGISNNFKKTCSSLGVNMNDVLETFMRDFSNGKYEVNQTVEVILKTEKE